MEILNIIVLIIVSLPVAVLGFFENEKDVDLTRGIVKAYMVMRPIYLLYVAMIFIIFVQLVLFFKKRKEEKKRHQQLLLPINIDKP